MNQNYIKQFRNLDDRALTLAKLVRERKVAQETVKAVKQPTTTEEENTHGRSN